MYITNGMTNMWGGGPHGPAGRPELSKRVPQIQQADPPTQA